MSAPLPPEAEARLREMADRTAREVWSKIFQTHTRDDDAEQILAALREAFAAGDAYRRERSAKVCDARADLWGRKPTVRDNLRAEAFSCAAAVRAEP